MFATDSAYADLLVVVVPPAGPRLTAPAKQRFSVGERLAVDCSAEATLPPANLTLYINQRPVPPGELEVRFQSDTAPSSQILHL